MSAPFHVWGMPTRRPDSDQPPWSERIRALRYIPPLLKMVYQTHGGYTVTIIVLRLVRALVPLALLWVGKLIIETVEVSYRGGQALDSQSLGILNADELGNAMLG